MLRFMQTLATNQRFLCLGDLAAKPEIHCGCRKEERGKWQIPGAIENVTCDDEQIFSRVPATDAPVERRDDYVENDEGERIKKHGEKSGCRWQPPIHARHLTTNVLDVCPDPGKIDKNIL